MLTARPNGQNQELCAFFKHFIYDPVTVSGDQAATNLAVVDAGNAWEETSLRAGDIDDGSHAFV